MILRLAILFCMVTISSCKTPSETGDYATEEVLVQLNDGAVVTGLEEAFETYQLRNQKVVSRPMNIHLFTFNSEKISQSELIQQLKSSALVKEAQPNNDVQLRN